MKDSAAKYFSILLLASVLTACGGGGGGGGGGDNNGAPQFSSAATASVDENQSGVVYTALASDSDGDTITFSISGGNDQAAFSIDSTSGAVTLLNAADFEAPSDANADGVFELTLSVEDGNGGSDQLALTLSVEDIAELTLQVSYPTPNANLGGDVTQTSVAGFLEDPEDGEALLSDVDFVRVNGVVASLEQDGNRVLWRTQVPVTSTPSQNTLEIEWVDSANTQQQISQVLFNRVAVLPFLEDIAIDASNNRALLIDSDLDALIAIDIDSGARTILSDASTGTGVNLSLGINDASVALDSANNRVLVTDSGLVAVIAIDLDTGDRNILSNNSAGIGSGTDLQQTTAPITLDSGRALLTDSGLDALVAINLATGDRVILSSASVGTGSNLQNPRGITLDSGANRALVVDTSLDALVAIDLTSGDRTILSDAQHG